MRNGDPSTAALSGLDPSQARAEGDPGLGSTAAAPGAPLGWPVQALSDRLCELLPGVQVEVVPQVVSTNSVLLERARLAEVRSPGSHLDDNVCPGQGNALKGRPLADQPCLLVAEHQTGGRGRQGRTWHSSPGASLTFSLALPMTPVSWSGLSLAVGVALADALEPPGAVPLRLGLKWPNDVCLQTVGEAAAPGGEALPGRKLGGILVETVSVGGLRMVVVGVGLNVRPQARETTGGASVACLDEIDPGVTVPEVLAQVVVPLVQALKQFEQAGFAPFAARYAARDVLFGRQVTLTHAAVSEGQAAGVADDGALRVQSVRGLSLVNSGEVSVRLQSLRPVASREDLV